MAVTPMGGSLRVGGTLELTGLDRSVSATRARGIVEVVPRYLPDFTEQDFAGVPAWCGLRPCSPDGLPYVGRPACAENLVGRHRARDDGREPRPDHRPAGRGDAVRRGALDRPGPLSPDRFS